MIRCHKVSQKAIASVLLLSPEEVQMLRNTLPIDYYCAFHKYSVFFFPEDACTRFI